MKTKINRHIFTQTRFQSDAISQLGFVVHQYTDSGRYQVDVNRHGKLVYSFQVDVCKHYKKPQFSADLAKLDKLIRGGSDSKSEKNCCCEAEDTVFELLEGGFGLFYVGSGSGGYSVCSYPIDEKVKSATAFDSAALSEGDLFGITLLRPGQYAFVEKSSQHKVAIEVAAVMPSKSRYVPPDPLHVDSKMLKKGLVIKLSAAQGLIYKASGGGESIAIELIKPYDDDSQGQSAKVAQWKRPTGKPYGGLSKNQ